MCGEHVPFVERAQLNRHHERHKMAAVNHFRSRQLRDDDHYMRQLNNDIDRLFYAYVRQNSAKVFSTTSSWYIDTGRTE